MLASRAEDPAVLPLRILDSVPTPDGRELVLYQRGDAFVIRIDDEDLMSSRAHGSEEELARIGLDALGARRAPRVLVGGLGMGFTLRAVLDSLAGDDGATVTVAELFPEVVAWNRGPLAPLAARPLDDPRVRVESGDVGRLLGASKAAFDLVLLDVDNGPEAMTLDANRHLYSPSGIDRIHAALSPGGAVAVWSAGHDPHFAHRLHRAGFDVAVHRVSARANGKGGRHVVFVGRRE